MFLVLAPVSFLSRHCVTVPSYQHCSQLRAFLYGCGGAVLTEIMASGWILYSSGKGGSSASYSKGGQANHQFHTNCSL